MMQLPTYPAPSRQLLWAEARRVPAEMSAFFAASPLLSLAPKGDGHSVLVLPGMLGDDRSTAALRTFLRRQGYEVCGWGQGRNLGLRPGVEDKMLDQVKQLADVSGTKISLVGWSLGGIYSRMIAKLMPEHVRNVITLGSPFACSPQSTNAWQVYAAISGQRPEDVPDHRAGRLDEPLAMPATSIFTRTDGVVAWQGCLGPIGPNSENIEVEASHCGLGTHPAVAYAVADRLAQPDGRWEPFHRHGWRSFFFPDPYRADKHTEGAPLPPAFREHHRSRGDTVRSAAANAPFIRQASSRPAHLAENRVAA